MTTPDTDTERRAAFQRMIEAHRAEMDRAEQMVCAAIASPRPRLALVKGDRALLLCRSTYGQPYRVTDLGQHGPTGHREYSAADTRGMAQEINAALRQGFTVIG